jgi:hypothetical protein
LCAAVPPGTAAILGGCLDGGMAMGNAQDRQSGKEAIQE